MRALNVDTIQIRRVEQQNFSLADSDDKIFAALGRSVKAGTVADLQRRSLIEAPNCIQAVARRIHNQIFFGLFAENNSIITLAAINRHAGNISVVGAVVNRIVARAAIEKNIGAAVGNGIIVRARIDGDTFASGLDNVFTRARVD